jgi:hypothetical protein
MKQELSSMVLFSLLIIFTMTSTVSAAEVSRQPASAGVPQKPVPGNVPAQPAAIKKPQTVIRVDPGRFQNMNKLISPYIYDTWKQISDNYNLTQGKLTAYEQQAMIYQKKRTECLEKDYAQSDQKSAGCLNTDTVIECGEKLISSCEKAEYEKFIGTKQELANNMKKIDDAAGALYQYLKY